MKQLDSLLAFVVENDGSDLHLTAGMPPVMRLHGALERMSDEALTPDATKALVQASMTPEQWEEFERELELDFAYELSGKARFRVNAYYQRESVGAAFRLIPARIPTFDELRLPRVLEEFSMKARGLVLVTGPTGAGKSTTLAAMVDYINRHKEVHVMTLEDPIEYLHHHLKSMVNQREIGRDSRGFAEALKHILRQDPDVILVGEMRDLETVRAALTAAETGHLVLTTLHTQGAAQTIDRIIDVFPPHQQSQVRVQLSMTLQGLLSQQLLPTVDGSGRVVACEVLRPTSAVRNIIREGKTQQLNNVMETGKSDSMMSMDSALADLCRRGLIAYETALQKAQDAEGLRLLLSRA
jgi:twitching motility protein PilT